MSTEPSVRAHLTGLLDGRPPLVRLVLDVTVRNPGADPRWFLLPDRLAETAGVGPVNGAAVRLLAGAGRVPMAHFQGRGGFYCLLLPADAEIRVHGLLVDADLDAEFAGPPVGAALGALAGRDLLVGDEPARQWYGSDPRCDPIADVQAGSGPLIAERWPEELPELAVTLADPHRMPTGITSPRHRDADA